MQVKHIIIATLAMFASLAAAQTENSDGFAWRTEMTAIISTDDTPFWMASNRYGLAPLDAPGGYASAGALYRGSFLSGWRWEAGLDLAVAAPRYRNAFVRQAYGELGYRSLKLIVGSKEQYTSLWDRELSSGDMVRSANARPMPEVMLSIPDYSPFWLAGRWVQLRGSFSVGRSFDTDYLRHFTQERQTYVRDVLWHYKSLHFRLKDSEGGFPLSLEFGLQHGAQWGGVSTDPKIGAQPRSIGDFLRVAAGMAGDDNATLSDQINVLGNQYGSYDFRLSYNASCGLGIGAYHQRYFEDKSGTEFLNGMDGLWGLQLDLPPSLRWIRKIVFEILETRNQTGPFHFIEFDHEKHPGRGGGADNYYNNGEYVTGLSYFNRSIGSPLLTSPEYNADGKLGFPDTRTHHLHFGIAGQLLPELTFRALFTVMKTWGTHYRPYLNTKKGMSGMGELSYSPAFLPGWTLTGTIAADRGDYLRKKGIGASIGIARNLAK
ncbi:MAG: capsule assembly Wzi family protein [Tannerellaceae bacterium]|jgi:hypothetical protein|nr:capsule assembly Wzi family protein [Tannerellaceae bacterium]